ncbi:MAG TPA: hypothetical protein PKN13_06505 [Accumulibacter sp.]|nr:hypothetical protein [Accumulibacter sp.]HMW18234.1 hypothetical protein [Accumulibacter sp.]HNC18333.1 hypothetical protein [Accumulibacter sp.]HND80925.1 hypothetical protein [Accumulibacter sp.]HNE13416.1 hypothetical protein [Accumulibacter sp.]
MSELDLQHDDHHALERFLVASRHHLLVATLVDGEALAAHDQREIGHCPVCPQHPPTFR